MTERNLGRRAPGPLLLAALSLAAAAAGCGAPAADPATPAASAATAVAEPAPDGQRDIVYELTGTADRADLELTDGHGRAVSMRGEPLPLSAAGRPGLHVTAAHDGRVRLSAHNTGALGSMTCRISENGKVLATNTVSGGLTVVTCEG
ncbi:hypothetical protein [Kitasatospora sp. NBC_00315]|uniref:hypothetical protein n=1 Tax=Kitasatospora sp. NBC_00315 TaxID=2975963 RepID=UPI0032477513